MNPTSILALITTLGPMLGPIITGLSGALPNLIPGLGTIFGSTPAVTNNNATKLLQQALNGMQATGVIQFDGQAGQPNSPLIADGNFGGRTFAAVKAAQAHFGFAVQEPLASLEMNILGTVLSKL